MLLCPNRMPQIGYMPSENQKLDQYLQKRMRMRKSYRSYGTFVIMNGRFAGVAGWMQPE